MVKITIRDKDDRISATLIKECVACCVGCNGEVSVLDRSDMFHTIAYIDTTTNTIILQDGSQYRKHTISIEK